MSAADEEPTAATDKEPTVKASGDRPRATTGKASAAEKSAEKQAENDAPPKVTIKGREAAWMTRLTDNAWLLIPVLVPVAVIVGMIQGAGAAFLVLIATALITVIALFWASVRTLLGETPLSGADAYALAAPRAEEEQKQAVLRALKDLEFERSVGKISDDDYSVLVSKYRAEAKRLLRVLEDHARPKRERVEGLVHARLVEAGLESTPATYRSTAEPEAADAATDVKPRKKKKGRAEKSPAEPRPRSVEIEPIDAPEKAAGDGATASPGGKANVDATWKSVVTMKTKESPAYTPPTKKCGECRTRNDADAVFCKKCGSRVFEGAAVDVQNTDAKPVTDRPDAPTGDAPHDAHDAHEEADDNERTGEETSR